MLKIIEIESSIRDSIPVGENSIINEVNGNGKIGGIKIGVKMAKSKKKNSVKLFLTKFKLFIENSKSGFFTLRAKIAFIVLR